MNRCFCKIFIGIFLSLQMVLFLSSPLFAADAEKVIKIGLSTPLSGPAAGWGMPQYQAQTLLFEEINKEGGISIKGEKLPVKFICYDDKAEASEGAIVAHKLAYDDKVLVVMGESGPPGRAMQPVLEEAGVLNYNCVVANDVPNENTPLLFPWFPRYAEVQSAQWPWIVKTYPNVKKVAKMSKNDDEGWFCEAMFKKYAPRSGIEIVGTELFESGTTDFTPILLKLLRKQPDMLDLGSCPPHTSGAIVKQARELGFTGIFSAMVAPNLDVVREVAGKENAEGFIGWASLGEPFTPVQLEFKQKFIERWGAENWTEFALFCYGSAQVIPQAIEKAQSLDPKDIAEAMRKNTFDTIFGKVWFGGKDYYGIDNQVLWNISVAVLKDGVPTVIANVPAGQY